MLIFLVFCLTKVVETIEHLIANGCGDNIVTEGVLIEKTLVRIVEEKEETMEETRKSALKSLETLLGLHFKLSKRPPVFDVLERVVSVFTRDPNDVKMQENVMHFLSSVSYHDTARSFLLLEMSQTQCKALLSSLSVLLTSWKAHRSDPTLGLSPSLHTMRYLSLFVANVAAGSNDETQTLFDSQCVSSLVDCLLLLLSPSSPSSSPSKESETVSTERRLADDIWYAITNMAAGSETQVISLVDDTALLSCIHLVLSRLTDTPIDGPSLKTLSEVLITLQHVLSITDDTDTLRRVVKGLAMDKHCEPSDKSPYLDEQKDVQETVAARSFREFVQVIERLASRVSQGKEQEQKRETAEEKRAKVSLTMALRCCKVLIDYELSDPLVCHKRLTQHLMASSVIKSVRSLRSTQGGSRSSDELESASRQLLLSTGRFYCTQILTESTSSATPTPTSV